MGTRAMILFTAAGLAFAGPPAAAAGPGAVFTMTDEVASNAVLAFSRDGRGALTPAGSFPTGGMGSGGGEGVLGSQGSVTLSGDGRFLFVVDAGSDEVSSFLVDGARLTLADVEPSGGLLPVSVTEHDGTVYVLNAGGAGNISALRVDHRGRLTPLGGSTRPLGSATAGGAQVSFDASGDVLAVTEKAAGAIALYAVDEDGRASPPRSFPSSGGVPFGFGFTRRDVLVVSEAAGGPAGTSAVSSYDVDGQAATLLSGSVPDAQQAACWLVVTSDGRLAFVANAASGDISSYAIDRRGELALVAGSAGALPSQGKPLDLALARGDRLLYALDAGNHGIVGFLNRADGALDPLGTLATGLPAHAVGLAAR